MAEYQEDFNMRYRKYHNHHQFKNGDIDAGVGRTLGSVSVGFNFSNKNKAAISQEIVALFLEKKLCSN